MCLCVLLHRTLFSRLVNILIEWSPLSLILMIACLTYLTNLTFCTLLTVVYSYFISNSLFQLKALICKHHANSAAFHQLATHSTCALAKWLEWRSFCKIALEALLQTLQQFHHALMSSSGLQFCSNFYLVAISAHICMSYISPLLFKTWIAQHHMRKSFWFLDSFLSDTSHFETQKKEGEEKPNKKKNQQNPTNQPTKQTQKKPQQKSRLIQNSIFREAVL